LLEYGEQSASGLLFASLTFARRSFDHLLKNIVWEDISPQLLRFDSEMDKYTHSALQLHETQPLEATVYQLHGNGATGGASLRPTAHVAREPHLAAMAAVFQPLHRILQITTPDDIKMSPLKHIIFGEAEKIMTKDRQMTEKFREQYPDADKEDTPESDLPVSTNFQPKDVSNQVQVSVLDAIKAGMPPNRIYQGDMVRRKDWLVMQARSKVPYIDHLDNDWSEERKKKFVRSALLARVDINGTSLWSLTNKSHHTKTAKKISMVMSELELAAAVRLNLAVGFKGLVMRATGNRTHCSCHHKTPIEDSADQHLAHGCPNGRGPRTSKHGDFVNVFASLAAESQFRVLIEQGVSTAGVDGPLTARHLCILRQFWKTGRVELIY
jgi:hypothetical protein